MEQIFASVVLLYMLVIVYLVDRIKWCFNAPDWYHDSKDLPIESWDQNTVTPTILDQEDFGLNMSYHAVCPVFSRVDEKGRTIVIARERLGETKPLFHKLKVTKYRNRMTIDDKEISTRERSYLNAIMKQLCRAADIRLHQVQIHLEGEAE